MKAKILGCVILLALLTVVVYKVASKNQRQPLEGIPQKNQLRWRVQQAKKEGLDKIEVEPPLIDYLGAEESDLNEVLQWYTVVVAKPVEQRTYEQTDTGNDLITWVRFRTIESLSPLRPPRCPACNSYTVPTEMLPLQPGEFLVPQTGGEKNVEGVNVREMSSNFPPFKSNREYLLLISLYPNGVAFTLGGPTGVFMVNEDGQVSPVSPKSHPLKEQMQSIYGNSLNHVKAVTKPSR
jgi:hypothetical protein